jgi:nucleotide-binding universal stress UspA family protein
MKEQPVKTILVPLDGSALAEQALPYVRLLATILGARVSLLHVVTEIDAPSPLAYDISSLYSMSDVIAARQERNHQSWQAVREHAEGYLESQAMRLKDEGFDTAIDVRFGAAPDVIVEVAEQREASLIVMATHGYSGLRRWALGSVTDRVVQSATAPVFVVRGGTPERQPALKRLLAPLDGSSFARQALPLAAELATCAGANLILLEAVAPVVEVNPARPLDRSNLAAVNNLDIKRAHAEDELSAQARALASADLAVRTIVATGHAAEVIVDEAALEQADLIVMATHGRGGVQRWALGSVADKVLHATTTPLVLVRVKEQ